LKVLQKTSLMMVNLTQALMHRWLIEDAGQEVSLAAATVAAANVVRSSKSLPANSMI